MTVALGLLAVLALILANGYFVAAEFAFVAARRGRLEDQAEAGDRKAARAVEVQKRLSFVLSGAQLGITVTSLVVGFIAEPVFAAALGPLLAVFDLGETAVRSISLTVGFLIATMAQMALGELGPKNLAIAKPEPIARALAGSTALYTRVAGPLIRLFDGSANRLLRAVGIEPVDELTGGVSPEELGLIITESGKKGALPEAQVALLSRALEFRTLRAADAMLPRPQVVSIPVTASCGELRDLAISSGHSRFPVVGEGLDDVHGIVEAKDVFGVAHDRRAEVGVEGLLKPIFAVPESALLRTILRDLREAHSQLAVVVDEHGGTAGIVTLEDIVEELVGDIQDEYDPAEPSVQALPDGSFLLPGSWRVDEAQRDTGLRMPSGDYDTVGGLVMERLGRLAEVGDVVSTGSVELRVEQMDGFAVRQVLAVPTEAGTDADAGGRAP
jgi:CBS domain containing-hemolysin-like protein